MILIPNAQKSYLHRPNPPKSSDYLHEIDLHLLAHHKSTMKILHRKYSSFHIAAFNWGWDRMWSYYTDFERSLQIVKKKEVLDCIS